MVFEYEVLAPPLLTSPVDNPFISYTAEMPSALIWADGISAILLLPLHDEPTKPGLFQAVQHLLGVGADGEGSHLDPVQGIALGRLGGLGGLLPGRDIGRAQILAQALGDGLTDVRGVLHDPAGALDGVVKLALAVHTGGGRIAYLIQPGVGLDVFRRSRRQRGQLAKHSPACIIPLAGDTVAKHPGRWG